MISQADNGQFPKNIKGDQRQESGQRVIISPRFLWILTLSFISILTGIILLLMPERLKITLIFIPPALVIGYLILLNPLVGIYLFFLYEFLRPYDFIPALIPLRLQLIIEALTLVSWLISLTISKKITWCRLHTVFLIFLATIGVTVLTASINGLALQVFQLIVVYFVIFVIAGSTEIKLKQLNALIWLLILVHAYLAIEAIRNYVGGQFIFSGEQTSGSVGSSFLRDENDTALAFNVFIPFAYFMMTQLKKLWHKFAAFLSLMVLIGGVIVTNSRGGMLGLAAAIVFCILNSKHRIVNLLIVIMITLLFIPIIPDQFWSEAKTISEVGEGTADLRIKYWEAALKIYLDYPIIGVGAGNGGVVLPQYVGEFFGDPATQWGRVFHGTIPQIMAELGTIGLISFLIMIFYIVKFMLKIKKKKIMSDSDHKSVQMANAIIVSLITYLVTGAFISTPYYPQFYSLLTLAIILHFINEREELPAESP